VVNGQYLWRFDHLADGYERLGRIVADVGVHGRAARQRPARGDQDRVAVGIGGRDRLGADAAAGAPAAILNHDRLAEHDA
jgi:hypothetical protein